MRPAQLIGVIIIFVALFLGLWLFVFLLFGSTCPTGYVLKSGTCCQDFNKDNRCDILSQGMQTGQTFVVTQPNTQQPEIQRLQQQVRSLQQQLESQRTTQVSGRTYCDSFGCYRIIDGRRYYFDERRSRDRDEWDLTVVVKDDDGDRLEDARVRIENDDRETEYTDEDGEAEFRNIEEDCYDIRVSKSGYETEHDDVCMTRDRKITIRLEEK